MGTETKRRRWVKPEATQVRLGAEVTSYAGLDPLPRHGLVVATGALGAPGGAAVAILADDRLSATAVAADQELA